MKAVVLSLLTILIGQISSAQVTATQPSSTETIRTADDYASRAFQDPWDKNQKTDLGTFTYSIDQPKVNLANITFSNGIFSATTATNDPGFWLLDTGNPYAANTGKTGKRFPIDSSKYKRLVMRMSLSGAGISTSNPGQEQILWSNHTIYPVNIPPGGFNTSNVVQTWPGWWIYSVNMESLGSAAGINWSAANVDSLRVDPLQVAGITMAVDWVRLVEDVPALYRNIQWTGSGAVDIYLDDDANSSNGMLAQIARNATGNTFSFYVGGLPEGTYRVVVCPAGAAGPYSYAPGSWQIQGIPVLTFTSPSPEGSTDDFATTQLGNPWDMNALSDIESSVSVSGLQITNINAEDEAGTSLGSVRVLRGFSTFTTNDWGDPYLYPFWFNGSGLTHTIDSNRYRILTLEMGLAGDRDINRGSIARIVWRNFHAKENVSEDIIWNHVSTSNVIQKLTLDMKTLELDPNSIGTSTVGWNGLIDAFRVDPHEFPEAREFWIKSVRLTSLETATSAYSIRWTYAAHAATGVSLSLFYDTTGTGFGGTPIAAGLNPTTGSYSWNVSALPSGTYYIYGVYTIAGSVVNRAYAPWPIIVGTVTPPTATMTLNHSLLNFATSGGTVATGSQDITVDVKGSGTVNWTVTSNRTWLQVSPSTGTGSGRFTVSIDSSALAAPGYDEALLTVSSSGAANSPQTAKVTLRALTNGSSAGPFGTIDTPTTTAAISGSIAVTGWAVDDIGVKQVTIWRDPVGSEPTHGNGYVYIGDALFVWGSRSDIETLYPNTPRSGRAGWGYLLLTNTLPNKGNGTFKIWAIAVDEEGHQLNLGSKTILVDNLHATKPFGAIDQPAPGATTSGTITSVGWALTPLPAMIATTGATLWVNVDGVDLGHPTYGGSRGDIASIFPGYLNTNSSAGSYLLNTTSFANGTHTISWNIYDNQGRGDGIGSRFFEILNGATGPAASLSAPAPGEAEVREIEQDRAFQLRTARLRRPTAAPTSYPAYRRGFHRDAALTPVLQAGEGLLEWVELQELDRLELHLPPGPQWSAALRVGDQLRPLPIGSTFDAEGGIFYWQLVPAFLGEFSLEFRAEDGTVLPVTVRVGASTSPTAIQ